jgi:formylglycine-generating enzyme required for sulfatase activity
MVYVPDGTFMMGLPEEITGNKPVKTTVKAFFLDRLEVSTERYLACVQTGACEPTKKCHREANATAKKPRLMHPINCVTHDQATKYCAQQGKRLPTESEWEFAARGSDGRIYPWGNDAPAKQLCWDKGKSKGTCPVGSFPAAASPSGALDMAGNVGEWTASPETEVAGPGAFRTRGGGYLIEEMARPGYDVRADRRDSRDGEDGFRDTGFRCAKDV